MKFKDQLEDMLDDFHRLHIQMGPIRGFDRAANVHRLALIGVIAGELRDLDLHGCDAQTVNMVTDLKQQCALIAQGLRKEQIFGNLGGVQSFLGSKFSILCGGLRDLYAHVLPGALEEFDYAFSG